MGRAALVTGGGGFVGQWLTRALLADGWAVTSAGLSMPDRTTGALTPSELDAVTWLRVDVRQSADVEGAVDACRPDAVFHLAGVSYVPDAQTSPTQTYDINTLGASRLLFVLKQRRDAGIADPRVLVVGSGTQYGRHDESELPLTETAEQWPRDVYAASKVAQELIALQAFRADSLRVICTRSFNHSGAGHASHFLLPALVRRTVELVRRGGRVLLLGNQDSVRDYLHVSDVVRAYILLVERGVEGEVYNVCSGVGVSARELAIDVLLRVGATAEITSDPALVREVDIPALVGSPAKLQRATGWRPERTRADIIDDLINAATH